MGSRKRIAEATKAFAARAAFTVASDQCRFREMYWERRRSDLAAKLERNQTSRIVKVGSGMAKRVGRALKDVRKADARTLRRRDLLLLIWWRIGEGEEERDEEAELRRMDSDLVLSDTLLGVLN